MTLRTPHRRALQPVLQPILRKGRGGGVVYATLAPGRTNANLTLSNANRTITKDATLADGMSKSSSGKTTGKWYFEAVVLAGIPSPFPSVGIASDAALLSVWVGGGSGAAQSSYGYYGQNGQSYHVSGGIAFGATWATGDVIGCAVDLTTGKIWWSKNNVWQASGNPAAGTGSQYTLTASLLYFAAVSVYGNAEQITIRLAAPELSYAPPAGFVAGWTA